jgi:RNA polymerase sigma factor (TIGR02999 family)
MASEAAEQVTMLLTRIGQRDERAAEELLPLVYGELRKLADAWMAKRVAGQTLQPTALVHEAYLRLVGKHSAGWENRRHFFFAAARAMQDILVENARKKARLKRGGDRARISTDQVVIPFESPPDHLLALTDALERLVAEDPTKHEMVMLRFFAGQTAREAAELMNIPLRTFERDWRFVRAKLHREMAESNQTAGGGATDD